MMDLWVLDPLSQPTTSRNLVAGFRAELGGQAAEIGTENGLADGGRNAVAFLGRGAVAMARKAAALGEQLPAPDLVFLIVRRLWKIGDRRRRSPFPEAAGHFFQ